MKNYDLSICIPARNERWLKNTVEDILKNRRGNTQIIVGLDEHWAEPQLIDHPDVVILHYSTSIGQRAIVNQCVRLSKAKWVAKVDSHCSFDEGFDVKLLSYTEDDWTIAPTMRNLHVFDFVCPDGHRRYQGTDNPCAECGKPTQKELMWIGKKSPQSRSFCFDPEPHFQYFREYNKRPEGKGDITESMSLQGSFFMCTRKKYWELEMGNESFGSWGSQGIQVAASTWLSGGKVMINNTTWYAHCFRTQGGTFGFPYEIHGRDQDKAKKYAKKLIYENKFPKQIYPTSWLVKRFMPVPGWSEKDLDKLTKAESTFVNSGPVKVGSLGVSHAIPLPVTDHTTTVSSDGSGEKMTIPTMGLPSLSGGSTVAHKDILSVGDQPEMSGIAAESIGADVVEDGDISSLPVGNGTDEQNIHQPVRAIQNLINSHLSITISGSTTTPNPTTTDGVNPNLGKNSTDGLGRDVHNTSITDFPSKSILFFTDNQLQLKIAHKVQHQLNKIGLPIVSASLKPMPHFGKNVHIKMKRGYEAYFTQILEGLKASDADIIYMCEHDCLYDISCFDYIPSRKDVFAYNQNWWKVWPDGFAAHWDANQVSGLCGYREHLINWYTEKLKQVTNGTFDRRYEPGGRDKSQYGIWNSKIPMVDIRHLSTLTKSHRSVKEFHDKSTAINFQESTINKIPHWSLTIEAIYGKIDK